MVVSGHGNGKIKTNGEEGENGGQGTREAGKMKTNFVYTSAIRSFLDQIFFEFAVSMQISVQRS